MNTSTPRTSAIAEHMLANLPEPYGRSPATDMVPSMKAWNQASRAYLREKAESDLRILFQRKWADVDHMVGLDLENDPPHLDAAGYVHHPMRYFAP